MLTHTHTHTSCTHTLLYSSAVCVCVCAAVVDMEDSGEVLGHLTVTVEGLEALRAIMEEQDRAAVSSQLPST